MNAERAKIVVEMIRNYVSTTDMLVSTKKLLLDIYQVLTEPDVVDGPQEGPAPRKKDLDPIADPPLVTGEAPIVIISCDASIKVNPGGPASVGVVIQTPGRQGIEFARPTRATTNNQAEYDAVYLGLTTYVDLHNNPGCPIHVRSDSQLVIKQLNLQINCQDPTLIKKRDLIREVANEIPVPVIFEWRPRNSTPELERANYLAQDLLGVARH